MTPVDREGIISKKYVRILVLRLFCKVMTIPKNLWAIILARTHHLNTKFMPNTCYLLLASGMESLLQLLGSSAKNSVP